MFQRKIVNFGTARFAWLIMEKAGVKYHSRQQLKLGQSPNWWKLQNSLERGIKSGKIAEAE